MGLRSVFSRRTTADAVRRMRAVVGVLDADLAQLATQLAAPVPATTLSDADWQRAEAARCAVELDLRGLDTEAAVIAVQVSDWHAKAAMAAGEGRGPLAEQARLRAAEAQHTLDAYRQEIGAVRTFLHEWAVRVRRDNPGGPTTPLANER